MALKSEAPPFSPLGVNLDLETMLVFKLLTKIPAKKFFMLLDLAPLRNILWPNEVIRFAFSRWNFLDRYRDD